MRLTAFASQIISCLHCSTILLYPIACNVGARPDATRSGRLSACHSSSQSKQARSGRGMDEILPPPGHRTQGGGKAPHCWRRFAVPWSATSHVLTSVFPSQNFKIFKFSKFPYFCRHKVVSARSRPTPHRVFFSSFREQAH